MTRFATIQGVEHGGTARILRPGEEDDEHLVLLAILRSHHLSIVLEPRVTGITVAPPSHLRGSHPISLSPSSITASFFAYLRDGDTIHFQNQDIKMDVTLEVANSTPIRSEDQDTEAAQMPNDAHSLLEAEDGQVQVKSSDTQPEATSSPPDWPHEPETDEDDFERSATPRPKRNPFVNQLTPATIQPPPLTIKETPKQAPSPDAHDPPFSTALDEHTDDGTAPSSSTMQRERNGDSPTVKVEQARRSKRFQKEDSQIKASVRLVTSVEIDPSSDATDATDEATFRSVSKSEALADVARDSTPVQSTEHGKYGSPDLGTMLDGNRLSGLTSTDLPKVQGREPTPIKEAVRPSSPLSSEVDLPAIARVTSQRSLSKASTKRSIAEQEDDDDDQEESVTNKKQKTQHLGTNAAAVVTETEPTGSEPPSKTKRGKLRPVSRIATQESGEEIAVAQKIFTPNGSAETKSSPIVSIPPKSGSKTPSSSATSMTGKPPQLLVSSNSVAKKQSYVKWLEQQGAKMTEKVPSRRTNFICIIKDGELGTTAKIIRSLALGKCVVTDKWVTDSKAAGILLQPEEYVHEDLQETIALDRRAIFEKKHLYFTSSLVKKYGEGWKDIEALAKEAGAKYVEHGSSSKVDKVKNREDVIFFGSEGEDSEKTHLINEYGHTVYHKDMLTRSIISGELATDEDGFALSASASVLKKRLR